MHLRADNNAFPTGLKRRQTFSRDKESDLDAYDIPPHDYDAQERRGAVGGLDDDDEGDSPFRKTKYTFSSAVERLPQSDSSSSLNSEQGLDPEDPRVTGRTPHNLDEIALEKEMLQNMDYRSRRKYIQRIKIEFNISRAFAFNLSLEPCLLNPHITSSHFQSTALPSEAGSRSDDVRGTLASH
jgi:hypothetical protein